MVSDFGMLYTNRSRHGTRYSAITMSSITTTPPFSNSVPTFPTPDFFARDTQQYDEYLLRRCKISTMVQHDEQAVL